MAFPEVFTALQQGTVDGQENPLPVIISAKFVAALAPVNAEFEKQFGKATLDKIRNVK